MTIQLPANLQRINEESDENADCLKMSLGLIYSFYREENGIIYKGKK